MSKVLLQVAIDKDLKMAGIEIAKRKGYGTLSALTRVLIQDFIEACEAKEAK